MSTQLNISRQNYVFAFPGQGSDPCGALAELYQHVPEVRHRIDTLLAIIEREAAQYEPELKPGLVTHVLLTREHSLPLPSGVAQLAVYGAAAVLNQLLEDAGVRPTLILAQSFGEIAARVCGGVLDIAQGVRAVCALNDAYRTEEGRGTMLLINLSEQATQALLDRFPASNLVLGSVNAPAQCIISGETADLEHLLAHHDDSVHPLRTVAIAYASHFPKHQEVARRLLENLQPLTPKPFNIPIYSTVLGRCYEPTDDLHEMFTRGVTQPTNLPHTLAQLPTDEHTVFIDLGVNSGMSVCIRKSLPPAQTYAPLAAPIETLRHLLLKAPTEQGAVAALRELANGPVDAQTHAQMARIFSDPQLHPRANQSFHDGHRQTYQRLQHLMRQLPEGIHAFKQPQLLMAVASHAAINDPSLFMGCVIQQGLCIGTLLAFEQDHPHAATWRRELEAGETLGVYALTEIGRSNSHMGACVEATFDADTRSFVLNTPNRAALKFANVGINNLNKVGVVFAQVTVQGQQCGVFAFVLPLSDAQGPRPGISMSSPAEIRAVPLDYGLASFDNVRLPFDAWLRDGASISASNQFHDPLGSTDRRLIRSLFAPKNVWAMVGVGLSSVMLACSTLALTHANRRTTQARIGNGTSLLAFRTQRRALFGCLATAYVMKCFANDSARLWIEGTASQASLQNTGTGDVTWTPWAAISQTLALTKALCAPAAEALATECRLRCGVAGALNLNRFADYEGMAKIYQDAGGNNRMILLDAAKVLIGQPLSEPTPPDPQGKLDDAEYWLAMAHTLEYRLLKQVADHVAQHRGEGEDDMQIWNSQLMIVARAGEAYAHRLAIESAVRAGDSLAQGLAKELGSALCSLYVLEYLNKHAAWFISEGIMDIARYRALEERLDALSDLLTTHVDLLIEAFGDGQATRAAITHSDDYPAALADKLQWAVG
ncbi:Acyl-coenzyme A oxidase [Pseudomonas antarctica]|uniref:Acyl-coenzyme A oxidase n=1 Tax=Pseudomonas antarctica TaxID=219572 RepID=A0A1G9WML4_9PSED|nr:acyltransferase domain-containing protein [Pseudomonas antarctica]KAF2409486.1 erythronolide synthase, modules 1 and 2 [Pseudomonas antarctica]SDM85396.1 Acyl-coenzyme A oxidase [Pseudomonas antarctica]